jgi:serine/threonine protein kinase
VETRKTIGRYEIRECIGRGGMGALFRALDPVLDREVAIKTMLADFSGDEAGRARFYREARAVARLQHRNIVTLFDFGEDDGTPYIVMEFLRGDTLGQRMKDGGRLPIDRVLDVAAQLCTGLHFAHARGVVHRDIKPPNIWLNEDGSVKLLDFGIAKFGDTAVTRVGGVVGSVSYMSPEQIAGDDDVDGRSDIFSVGIVLYELLSGKRPFPGDSPTAIMMRIMHEPPLPLEAPGAPPQLLALIERALQKDRMRRFQQAGELASDLRALQFTLSGPHGVGRVPDHLASTAPQSPASSLAAANASMPGADVRFGAPSRSASPAAPSASAALSSSLAAAAVAHEEPAALARDEPGPGPGGWSMGTSDDLVADAMIGSSSMRDDAALPSAPSASSRLAGQRTGLAKWAAWAKRWPALAVAGGAMAIASFVFVLLMRAESANEGAVAARGAASGSAATDSSAKTSAGPATGGAPADGRTVAVSPTTGDPTSASNPAHAADSTDKRAADSTDKADKADKNAAAAVENSELRVLLSGGYAFSVMDDTGRLLSGPSTRHDLGVAPKQALRLRAPQYHLNQRIIVDGRPASTVRLQAAALGRLTVRTGRETCRVSLNGESLGYPPIAELPVASGKYRLALTCPDGDVQTSTVTIAPGATELALIR